MEIKSLGKIDFDTVFEAFQAAFADYEMQVDRTQLQVMLKRRGFNPNLSFAAFDEDRIVAFTLNGIGNFNGLSTAYDTGTGTLKEYRGQGLATRVFEYSIPCLKQHKIDQYLLEVLQHNTGAVSVYRNLGFEPTREFNYFRQQNAAIDIEPKNSSASFVVREIAIPDTNLVSGFWDFTPSWQNGFESIGRTAGDFVSLGAFAGDKLVGYSVFEPVSGDVTQIAVDKENRRRGIASLLLGEMVRLNRNENLKVLNTDVTYRSMTGFLQAKNIELKGRQFEMIRKI